MKSLSLAQMEKNAVAEAFKFERSKAADICHDDERGPFLMLLTTDEINQVLDSVMPERTQDAQIWRIVRWMQENDHFHNEFDYARVFYDWCCYPYDEQELKDLLRDYGDAEGLSFVHIVWFKIREWLRGEIAVALNGETMKSETEKRAAVYLSRWKQYKVGAA